MNLVLGAECYRKQIIEMLSDWGQEHIIPSVLSQGDPVEDFTGFLDIITTDKPNGNFVPSTTYFCYVPDKEKIVGAVNIRHYLTDDLLAVGHIGGGISPSYRKQGYGKDLLQQALQRANTDFHLKQVLIVCDSKNLASQKTIESCGGKMCDMLIYKGGNKCYRYWFALSGGA